MHEIARLPPQVRSATRDQVYQVLAHFASVDEHGPIEVKRAFLMAADGLLEADVFARPGFLRGSQRFAQYIKKPAPKLFPDYGIPSGIANLMRQTIWELYLQGVLAPAPRKAHEVRSHPPHKHENSWLCLDQFFLTPYGVDILLDSTNRILVYDPDGYLTNFRNAEPSPDPEMMRYLRECVSVFRDNHLLASVVLLGIASERLVEYLAERPRDALGEPEGNNWYKRYGNKDISKKFSSIIGKLKNEYGEPDVNTDAFKALELTFQYIRLARNDIAHPKNRQFTTNEVSGLIHNFVQYFGYMNDIIAFLAQHPKQAS